MSIYIKDNNIIKNIYLGIDNTPKKIKKGYINTDSQLKIFYNNNKDDENKILPSGYIELEYITNQNGAFFEIILNNNNNNNNVFGSLDIDFSTIESTSNKFIFGYYHQNNPYSICINTNSNRIINYIRGGSITINNSTKTKSNIKWNIFNNSNNQYETILNDNIRQSLVGIGKALPNPIKFFVFQGYSSMYRSGGNGINMYSFKYYSDNLLSKNNLTINLIPCINPNSEVGMYDTESGTFYGSIGNNTFIAGPEI